MMEENETALFLKTRKIIGLINHIFNCWRLEGYSLQFGCDLAGV